MSRKWHKGAPPHVGWWNAATGLYDDVWSWWDGSEWSRGAASYFTSEQAAESAISKRAWGVDVYWTRYYPKNARVPRIDPRKVK